MTFHELKNKLETEKHQTGMIRVKCGKRSDFPDLPIIYTEDIRDLPYTLRIYEFITVGIMTVGILFMRMAEEESSY